MLRFALITAPKSVVNRSQVPVVSGSADDEGTCVGVFAVFAGANRHLASFRSPT